MNTRGVKAVRPGLRAPTRKLSGVRRAGVHWVYCFLFFFLLMISPAFPPSLQAAGKDNSSEPLIGPTRTITLKVAVEESFGVGISWKREVKKLVRIASETFKESFGIEFMITQWEIWKADRTLGTMQAVLDDLKKKVGPGEVDMVFGVLGPSGASATGIADYFNGYVLLRLAAPVDTVPIAVHELGHIFGAVDLDEPGSVMNPRDPGSAFDAFSARVISLNKNRTFHTQAFPFHQRLIKEVIAEYEGRAALKRDEPELHLFLAYLYIEIADYASATNACIEVLKTNSELTEIHNLLGNLYLAQGRTNEAIAEYRKVLEWNRDLPAVHFNLGVASLKNGAEDEATSEFREAVRLNPNFAEAHANLGRQFLKKGELDAALLHARTALKIHPDFPEGLCILGAALILKESERSLEEAASILQKAVALKPGLPEAHAILGIAYGFQGRDEEAEAELSKTLQLKPGSIGAHMSLAILNKKNGREEKSAYHFGRVVEIDPDFAARHGFLTPSNAVPSWSMVLPEVFRQK